MELQEVIAQLGLVLESAPDQLCRIIVTQIDPDAIGSAVALKAVLGNAFHRDATILYCGAVGHPQNIYLFTRYDLRRFMTPIAEDPDADKGVTILVDSCSTTDRRIPANLVLRPRVVIDHHREDDGKVERNGLIWIEDVGATATLVTELCLKIAPAVLENPVNALLLALGIYTDTKSLKHTRRRDRQAYDIVCGNAGENEFASAVNYSIRPSYFKQLARAIEKAQQKEGKLVTGIGTVQSDEGDNVSTVADELIRMEGVESVIIWALIEKVIRISARTRGATIDLNQFMKRCFQNGGGKVGPDGHGEGGAVVEMNFPPMLAGKKSRLAIEAAVMHAICGAVFGE